MSEVGGYEAFAMYHALKLHFTGSYDFVKYNGKCNITKDQFSLRKDKFTFYKLSRKYKREELFGFFVANLLKNPKLFPIIADENLAETLDLVFNGSRADDRKKWMAGE